MSQYRSVTAIIPQLLNVIPFTELTLRNEIEVFTGTLWNKAPEILSSSDCWIELQKILSRNILSLHEPWQLMVLDIFNGTHQE